MTAPAHALLRAISEARFADACSRTAEYVASVEEAVRTLPPASPEVAQLLARALTAIKEARRLALCERAALALRAEEMRNARRYASPDAAIPQVNVAG
ncbi:MAG TPA: hypothetical protein VN428_06920 [Bryobacteraceae bacterium]|nr:hypothetical protein [Bryobacteraceae bacterium]